MNETIKLSLSIGQMVVVEESSLMELEHNHVVAPLRYGKTFFDTSKHFEN